MSDTNSSLAERLGQALVRAMKDRDSLRVSTLRLVRSALQNREIEKREPLSEAEVLQVLATQAKQRREAIEQFRAGSREDLAAKEEDELRILQEFLPEELSEEELREMIREAIQASGAQGPKDMGKVMSVLMPRVRGRSDGKVVSGMVRGALTVGGAG